MYRLALSGGEMLAKDLVDRVVEYTEGGISVLHLSFRKDKSCSYQIFVERISYEKTENNKKVAFIAFFDL